MESCGKKETTSEQEKRVKQNLSKIKNKFIVISGKGGVGKTTVAINLAYGLAMKGNKVGILDVDIHGPNVAKMLGIKWQELKGSEENGIEPATVGFGLKVMSMALVLKDSDKPIIWRGPLKMMTIKQFLGDVHWGELDYLIIDSPPGTGDEPLSVCQIIPDVNGAIVVTTPQEVAILDSRKSVIFAKELKVPVVGVVENMSGFMCPHCKKDIELFGTGGGEKAALELGVPFLGKIPMDAAMVKFGDSGQPVVSMESMTETAKPIIELVNKVMNYSPVTHDLSSTAK